MKNKNVSLQIKEKGLKRFEKKKLFTQKYFLLINKLK